MTAPDVSPPAKVLIIKPSSIGDVVGAIPVLRGLARSFPRAHLAWLVTPACADILAGQPHLDEVIPFERKRFGRIGGSFGATKDFLCFCRELRRQRFDWVIDLQGLFRSGFLAGVTAAPVRAGFADAREFAWMFYTHRVAAGASHTIDRNIELARALGADARSEDLALLVSQGARSAVESLLRESHVDKGRYVVVAPGTRWTNKLYPRRHWRRVVAELAGELAVVVAGAPDEQCLCAEVAAGRAGVINLAGRTSLPELAALIASAAAVICCDSAASFIAPAVGTPFVTLMGPTRPECTGPYGRGGMALSADIPCLGCLKRSCRHVTCMQWISPGEVLAATRRVMGGSVRRPLSMDSATARIEASVTGRRRGRENR